MFRKEGVLPVTVAVVVSLFLVVSWVQAVTTISTDITTGGALSVTGASTLTGNVTAAGTLGVTGASTLTGAVAASSTVQVTGLTTLYAGAESAVTRATGATGSFQNFAGDLTYQGAAGSTSGYHAGVMGNFLGDTLTNANATIHAGTIGKYSVTTSDALVGPKAGLVGEAETSVANSAVMAVLGGDSGTVTPGAAYGVRYLNSTAASKFGYGLDLFSAAVGNYKAVDYGTADIRLQNGETISNGTDGTITFGSTLIKGTGTGSLINVGGALKVSGTTASDNALATIGTLVTDAGADVSANTGRLTGLQINLASSGSTVTGFRGIDSRVTDTGTAANVVGLQAFAKKTAGVSAAELWGTNSIAQLTGGAVLNAYGVVGDLTIGTGATITDVQLNSFATAGFFQSFIHTDAILAKAIDSALTAVISSNAGRGKSAKGTFGVTSVLNGALSQSTEGASAAYKIMDFNTGANFDYGLDLFYSDSPYSNVFGTADIRLSAGNHLISGTAATRQAVETAFPAAPIGSIYVSTDAGRVYVKVTDAGAATDWQRVTTTAVD